MYDVPGQLNLFTAVCRLPGAPRRQPQLNPPHNERETSKRAAAKIRAHAPFIRERMMAFFATRGERGATDQECQVGLSLPGNTQRPQRLELMKRGLIRDSGQQRPTPSGHLAIVWTIFSGKKESAGAPS